jgi:hypothetical protein
LAKRERFSRMKGKDQFLRRVDGTGFVSLTISKSSRRRTTAATEGIEEEDEEDLFKFVWLKSNHSAQNLLSSPLLYKSVKIRIYNIIILPVILYGYETWSLTLREECRLRGSENRVLRRIFGPKRVKMTGGWRKLHNEELHNLYSSPNIIRMIKSKRMRWVEHVARMEEKRNASRVFVGKSERKRPLGRPISRF